MVCGICSWKIPEKKIKKCQSSKLRSGGWSIFVHLKYRTYAKSQHWIIILRRFSSVHQPCHSTIVFQASSMMPSKVSIFTNLEAGVSVFSGKKMPHTFSTKKKEGHQRFPTQNQKTKNIWNTSNPSEKIIDVCLLFHVCFFPLERNIRDAYVLPNSGPSTHLESPSFLRCQETSWSTYSSGSGLSTSARLPGPGWTSLISREIFHDFMEFHWLINELLNHWTT